MSKWRGFATTWLGTSARSRFERFPSRFLGPLVVVMIGIAISEGVERKVAVISIAGAIAYLGVMFVSPEWGFASLKSSGIILLAGGSLGAIVIYTALVADAAPLAMNANLFIFVSFAVIFLVADMLFTCTAFRWYSRHMTSSFCPDCGRRLGREQRYGYDDTDRGGGRVIRQNITVAVDVCRCGYSKAVGVYDPHFRPL